ncbi:hypothetical protein EVAR_12206_1 [Eumeta japonica]|uniref:Uncharacterized protein n=1 Tax=Eumeta variegata TaxID=151549 RepID=A0A4C1UIF4_EUMVA|nr:hypothetical protein EVAR_12206_1 [Eumeta japonica]
MSLNESSRGYYEKLSEFLCSNNLRMNFLPNRVPKVGMVEPSSMVNDHWFRELAVSSCTLVKRTSGAAEDRRRQCDDDVRDRRLKMLPIDRSGVI